MPEGSQVYCDFHFITILIFENILALREPGVLFIPQLLPNEKNLQICFFTQRIIQPITGSLS
jgi:hypothetical protein